MILLQLLFTAPLHVHRLIELLAVALMVLLVNIFEMFLLFVLFDLMLLSHVDFLGLLVRLPPTVILILFFLQTAPLLV